MDGGGDGWRRRVEVAGDVDGRWRGSGLIATYLGNLLLSLVDLV